MSERFADLKKVPKDPTVRLLAIANAKLATKLTTPANAQVGEVMEMLAKEEAIPDMLRVMSIALPARERIWWSCLAGRDVIGPDAEKVPLPLETAEKWVRKPSDETRRVAIGAIETADIDDDTVLCATAVAYYDGKLGTDNLAELDAPAGASEVAAFGMNMLALSALGGDMKTAADLLIDRAVDIARGGNGNVKRKEEVEAS